ncbi:MAG: hypothetical protein M3680_07300 [Myxococcota bacterium]|nr:hypothetical protein [Myxococcota bacterium]
MQQLPHQPLRRGLSLVTLGVSLAACVGDPSSTGDDAPPDVEPTTCEATRAYLGFGGGALDADRAAIVAGSDRVRIKPYAALSAEYRAALGLADFDTRAFAATFGAPPARWFSEPAASANTLYAAFALAYDACSRQTATAAAYASAPTAELAALNCRDYARRAWHREATDDEVLACATYAVDQTDPADEPRRRWAYACAAVLSASGFIAY